MSSGAHIPLRPLMSVAEIPIRQEPATAPRSRSIGRALIKSSALLRRLLSLLTLTVPLSYFAEFAIGGGLFRARAFELLHVNGFMHAVVVPGMKIGETLFAARMVYNGWNFLYVIMAVVALIVRHYIMTPIYRLEDRIKTKYAPARPQKKMPLGVRIQVPGVPSRPVQR